MNKVYAVILVSAGAALIVLSWNGPEPLNVALSHFFAHAPTSVRIWLFLAGVVLSAIGLYHAWCDRGRYD